MTALRVVQAGLKDQSRRASALPGPHLLDGAVVQLALMVMAPGPGLLLGDGVAVGGGIRVLGDLGQLRLVQTIGPLVLLGPGHKFGSGRRFGAFRAGHGCIRCYRIYCGRWWAGLLHRFTALQGGDRPWPAGRVLVGPVLLGGSVKSIGSAGNVEDGSERRERRESGVAAAVLLLPWL